MATKIAVAIAWWLAIAADDTHGYDQTNRNGPDYDCSSFVGHGLYEAGFNINPEVTTSTMYSALIACGFTVVDMDAPRKAGDIFLVYNDDNHHVVACINSTQIVQASINELGTTTGGQTGDQTGTEIATRNFYTPKGGWSYHFRAPAESTTQEWISGNRYLSTDEMQNNAEITYTYLAARGWSLNAVAALLGNLQRESTINPAIWQNLTEADSNGYGLAQWTPSTKYISWANNNGYDITDGDYQLLFIDSETESKGFWIDRGYSISFADFKKSTQDVEYLTLAFCYNYENAGVTADDERIANAQYWYTYLSTYDVSGGGNTVTPSAGNLYKYIENSGYNTAQLSDEQKAFLQTLSIYDRVSLVYKWQRNKQYGTDFWGKRLTQTKGSYRINDVRKNGFLVLQYKNEPCVIYVNPKYVKEVST
jgi:hypothetical protein